MDRLVFISGSAFPDSRKIYLYYVSIVNSTRNSEETRDEKFNQEMVSFDIFKKIKKQNWRKEVSSYKRVKRIIREFTIHFIIVSLKFSHCL